jgi:hypothetical protein
MVFFGDEFCLVIILFWLVSLTSWFVDLVRCHPPLNREWPKLHTKDLGLERSDGSGERCGVNKVS